MFDSMAGQHKGINMNAVLVTGATGSLGRAVVSTLCTKGLKVRATARNLAKAAFLVTNVVPDFKTVEGDRFSPFSRTTVATLRASVMRLSR